MGISGWGLSFGRGSGLSDRNFYKADTKICNRGMHMHNPLYKIHISKTFPFQKKKFLKLQSKLAIQYTPPKLWQLSIANFKCFPQRRRIAAMGYNIYPTSIIKKVGKNFFPSHAHNIHTHIYYILIAPAQNAQARIKYSMSPQSMI